MVAILLLFTVEVQHCPTEDDTSVVASGNI